MNPIGGYFELELPQGEEYHNNAIRLNTGRNALEYVLRAKQYKMVYLPYYTCDVMLEPIKKLDLNFEFYNIDENFQPIFDFSRVKAIDVFVYTNYFGVCDNQVFKISKQCKNLIIDNSQAFFSKPLHGIDTFYSPRKFFGVADGAYLYTNKELEIEFEQDISLNRVEHLLGRIEEGAEAYYQKFKKNDDSLTGQSIKGMSKLSHRMLQGIDYNIAAIKRIGNFKFLHKALKELNLLDININNDFTPMVYPFLCENGDKLHAKLIKNKIFVATYWPNLKGVHLFSNNFENLLINQLLPLPIDQRYSIEQMKTLLEIIQT